MPNPFNTNRNTVAPHRVEKALVEEKTEVLVEPEKKEPAPKKPKKKNLLAGLIEEKPEGKSYALYLDVDLVEEIDRLAKETKTNRSRIVNVLLRKEIFGE